MAKVRVYELARELGVESKQLVTRLKNEGFDIASHQSTVQPGDIEKIRALIGGAASPAKPAASQATAAVASSSERVIRRRKKVVTGEDSTGEEVQKEVTELFEVGGTVRRAEPEKKPAEEVSEVTQTSDQEVSAKEVEPEAPAPAPTRSPFRKPNSDGATIVRRATPEEIEAHQQRSAAEEERFARTSRREDSRGVRVTGIGIKTGSKAAADAADAPADPFANSTSRTAGEHRPVKKTKEEEDEEIAIRRATPKQRRSTNELRTLQNLTKTGAIDDVESILERNASKARRTFTPTGSSARRQDVKRRKDLKKTKLTTPRAEYRVVEMMSHIKVGELARQLSIKSGDIIKKLMTGGEMLTINDVLDFDTASLIANEYQYEVKNIEKNDDAIIKDATKEYSDVAMRPRPPVVTVMGHVDHGKTSILDAIRQTEVAAGEAGGITQHIGAYTVEKDGRVIAFLDTPGHEAFSSMRARGAKLTDIVVLVVAADDGVMPQTVEAINHAKDANVPLIVAINKIDKGEKNLDRVFAELMEHGIQSEEWGGETQFVKVSALEKIGLDKLLEAILLQAEVLDLNAQYDCPAECTVVEAHLDKGRGPVATLMVTKGTLKKGDYIVAGTTNGNVRAMVDYRGHSLEFATPSIPVEIIGLADVPMAGDPVNVVENERVSKEIISWRHAQILKTQSGRSDVTGIEALLSKMQDSLMLTLPVIIKGDTQGSVEALHDAFTKLNTDQVKNRVVHKATGGITESDVRLAQASGAVIVGFNVRASSNLEQEAKRLTIPVNYYSVIYDAVDAIKSLMAGKLPPILKEVIQGHAEVRELISVSKVGNIAGTSVIDGKITRAAKLRLIRDDIVVYEGRIGSLRRFKDDVREVASGYECGITIDGFNDIKLGDIIEAFVIEEERQSL